MPVLLLISVVPALMALAIFGLGIATIVQGVRVFRKSNNELEKMFGVVFVILGAGLCAMIYLGAVMVWYTATTLAALPRI